MEINSRERCEEIHNAFEDLPGLKLNGDRISPVKHLVLRNMNASREEDKAVMTEVVERVRHLRKFYLPRLKLLIMHSTQCSPFF